VQTDLAVVRAIRCNAGIDAVIAKTLEQARDHQRQRRPDQRRHVECRSGV
jgi:hypothetical protein